MLSYSTQNLGDDIQSLALERLLPRVDLRVDRDDVTPAVTWGEDVRWIINGWHAAGIHRLWPPQTSARCLFVGFHATGKEVLPPATRLPIGCRDPWTFELCTRQGLDAWISWCATLTFQQPAVTRGDEVLLVDLPPHDVARLPPEIAERGISLSHNLPPDVDRAALAAARIDRYARAQWVVTNRLHALLPCAALGTPVVFVQPHYSENRYRGYLHLAWRIDNAPWKCPRPRLDPEVVQSLALPLRHAVQSFIES
ncbi:hypothetical protein NA78x_002972 [Anatilimnocola sp. NA78]|uniref:hypothetical protein n=1 Tax=Anatilimnocola sp. NA78 TaxID=3415683 RepID=UPI003CE543DA